MRNVIFVICGLFVLFCACWGPVLLSFHYMNGWFMVCYVAAFLIIQADRYRGYPYSDGSSGSDPDDFMD